MSTPGVVDDGVHCSERVDLIGDVEDLGTTRKVADDEFSAALDEIVEPGGALTVSGVDDDVVADVDEAGGCGPTDTSR